ncbi:MAG: glycosyltransferase family 2 protein [bacterium]|nr:glycosyltransferase family 2 protein [bacterium]
MKEIQLSVCIPTYEMHGEAERLLTRSFDMLKKQTFKNFEVIISDNSENDVVKNLCENTEYESLDIKYFKNPQKGASVNTNGALKKASGKFIKILYMDDYLADQNSLQDIVDNFKGHWLVTGCGHDTGDGKIINLHFPTYNKKVYLGKNTIGAPSVLTIKNENPLMLDENLIWLLDCDYYKRLYDKYGEPDVLNKVNVIIGLGKHQTTSYIKYKTRWKEKWLMVKKYGKNGLLKSLKLW